MTEDELAASCGLENGAEMRPLMAAVDTCLASTRVACERWKLDDGTRAGLLKLRLLSVARSAESDDPA